MVLSNKKLKAKFRSLLAESLAAPKDSASGDVNEQLESVKEILGSRKKPRPSSKRGKRRKKPKDSEPVEESGDAQKENQENDESIGLKEEKQQKKKSGKRKREGDGANEATENEQQQQQQQQKQKKKQKKKKKDKKKVKGKGKKEDKQEDEKHEKGNESISGESNERRVQGSINIERSEQDAKKVYVGGIPYYSTEEDIRSFFEGCGTVTEVDCMRFAESGKFRGIAILTFKTEAAAKRALALNGADMGGFYLKIKPFKANHTQKSDFAPEMVEGYNRIYVGNLSWDITEDDLRKLFSDCKISSIRWGTDKETDDFKGYAHVDFVDSVSLTIALKLDQNAICGRPVKIRCAVPKREVETKSSSEPSGKKAEASTNEGGSKKKRRTCYECGVPGHLSSSCPKKIAVEVNGSGADS
ncbi:protein gar2 [Phoenix dactylifera]|uniref:Protein gar2 n=1 Tax=Phoenix dactylifera TaxID=42345 RepID=A0A8B9AQF0_PHODC|nr:protein gar2 [Phoenix dactylifera]